MNLPLIFTFAPVPLTEELSPLAHAAILNRRRQSEIETIPAPRRSISPETEKSKVGSL